MPLSVLVVEDDEIVRPLMVEALSLFGLYVIECAFGEEAVDVLEANPDLSLVITDVRMPGNVDGLALSRLIWTRWPNLPVVIVSGDTVLPPGFLPPMQGSSPSRFL